jgi:hypothetical protein
MIGKVRYVEDRVLKNASAIGHAKEVIQLQWW